MTQLAYASSVPATLEDGVGRNSRCGSEVRRPERILIVDDNEVNRMLLAGILRREGYSLSIAANGRQALELARRENPDLVLLDIMMPGMDGYEVCAELKKDVENENLPVIFLSALSEAANKVKGLERGAVDYVTKPFDRSEVLARVRTHLKIRRLTLDLVAANRDLATKQRSLDEDLQAAGDIQRSLIPKERPWVDTIEVAWRFAPCDRIGGDVFNFYKVDDLHMAIYVVDISGHGVPAAMLTVSISQSLSPHAGGLVKQDGRGAKAAGIASPAEVLRRLDAEYPIERFDKYFTMCYLLLRLADGRLRYSRAGHPMPVVVHPNGTLECLDIGGTIIGLGRERFEEGEIGLGRGDRLFLYTDGILEFANPDGELYGEERFLQQLLQGRGQPLDAVCGAVMDSLRIFAEGRQAQDDVTLLAIEYRGSGGGFEFSPRRRGDQGASAFSAAASSSKIRKTR